MNDNRDDTVKPGHLANGGPLIHRTNRGDPVSRKSIKMVIMKNPGNRSKKADDGFGKVVLDWKAPK